MPASVEAISQFLLHSFEEVAIDPKSDTWVAVAHALRDGQDVGTVVNFQVISDVRSTPNSHAAVAVGELFVMVRDHDGAGLSSAGVHGLREVEG